MTLSTEYSNQSIAALFLAKKEAALFLANKEKEMRRRNYDEIISHYTQYGYTHILSRAGDYSSVHLADTSKAFPAPFLQVTIASELKKCTCTICYVNGLLTIHLGPFDWNHPEFSYFENRINDLLFFGES